MRTSTFKDHADTDMHKYAMAKKAQSSGPCEYAPIARALAQSSMDAASTTKIKRKFETAYVIAKEKLACARCFKRMSCVQCEQLRLFLRPRGPLISL